MLLQREQSKQFTVQQPQQQPFIVAKQFPQLIAVIVAIVVPVVIAFDWHLP